MLIEYKEITSDRLVEYSKIESKYSVTKKYEIKKINNGLGGLLLDLIDVEEYTRDFGDGVGRLSDKFDLSNWKFYIAFDGTRLVGGCIVATKTPNVNMLEGREDLAVLWDIRVIEEYKYQGIGQHLFDLAKNFAKENGFKQLKIECQNTNPIAVKFYHKQGAVLSAINEYAYSDYKNEVQLLWYLNID
ncbi:MAG: GNAT family N-acetyltransferase [Clostridia bacterium]|nr:GNAT family N-acetyltransferase [Clostridia bacterium]